MRSILSILFCCILCVQNISVCNAGIFGSNATIQTIRENWAKQQQAGMGAIPQDLQVIMNNFFTSPEANEQNVKKGLSSYLGRQVPKLTRQQKKTLTSIVLDGKIQASAMQSGMPQQMQQPYNQGNQMYDGLPGNPYTEEEAAESPMQSAQQKFQAAQAAFNIIQSNPQATSSDITNMLVRQGIEQKIAKAAAKYFAPKAKAKKSKRKKKQKQTEMSADTQGDDESADQPKKKKKKKKSKKKRKNKKKQQVVEQNDDED